MFASRLVGMPLFSGAGLSPRSPVTITADLLKFVGDGTAAKVDGAKLLAGMSRRASVNAFRDFASTSGFCTMGILGPTGIDP
jgi:hypothetical protein